jgi:hypothetical protein
MYSDSQLWLLWNAGLLARLFGSDRVTIIGDDWRSIEIDDFPLPENWSRENSQLVIRFPKLGTIFSVPPDHFYLDKGLRTKSGNTLRHYYEADYWFNDRSDSEYARYSFHVDPDTWNPIRRIRAGTTLIDVLDELYISMVGAAERSDK